MTISSSPSIAIAGAGLGGLCLAQSLHKAGVDVHVYERDRDPFERRRGYRITVDPLGRAALRRCLPDALFELAAAVAGKPGGYFRFTNKNLRDAFKIDVAADPDAGGQMDRQTLRAILLRGIEDRVHYGMSAAGVDQDGDGAILRFADGGSVRADVVVGADGAGSALRADVLPGHEPVDTGMRAVYGQTPLQVAGRRMIPAALGKSGVLAIGDAPGHSVFFTAMRFGERPSVAFARLADGANAPVEEDYVMWALMYPAADDPFADGPIPPARLHEFAGKSVSGFHPAIQDLVAEGQPDCTIRVPLLVAQRPRVRAAARATLLGDAVHVMPPMGAHGGNTAMRDAASLATRLEHAIANDEPLDEAITAYHNDMVLYAFKAVDAASKQRGRLTNTNPVQRWLLLRALPRMHRITVPATVVASSSA
ncbi:FAD-dependent oxidoreductase [Nocardia sp. alder85J]|uniref:FAD-dependent oxidoreductase n=1 Tax=Nocardia sp. alder85J TaxID=2862949 RepID=UPI001CD6E1A7|nr:NAD(P)/FAD-dependent oxidoreductase [Nocardia sp. alder85J]MCX4098390.1 NAD(P)/FAD-dependent oxidoreductase [Nocardia sp. alder85J]